MNLKLKNAKNIGLKVKIIALAAVIAASGALFSSCGENDSEDASRISTAAKSEVSSTAGETTASTAKKTTEKNTAETAKRTSAQGNSGNNKKTEKTTKSNSSGSGSSNSSQSTKNEAYKRYMQLFKSVPSGGSVSLKSADIRKGYLILVNNDYKYDSTQSQDLMEFEDLEKRSFYVAYSGLDADRFTAKQFNSMNRQYLNKYDEKLTVCSSFRSVKKQTQLFNDSVARQGEEETLKWFTRPGCSEHHTGFSIDYNTDSFGESAFTGKGSQGYIKQICDNYGFILRYTAEKKPITGIAPEAWHFRQVGIPHASYIMKNGVCLEEYIDIVKKYSESSPLTVTVNGQTYYIFYAKSQGDSTKINLSGYSSYLSSGNNIDGFIITAVK